MKFWGIEKVLSGNLVPNVTNKVPLHLRLAFPPQVLHVGIQKVTEGVRPGSAHRLALLYKLAQVRVKLI